MAEPYTGTDRRHNGRDRRHGNSQNSGRDWTSLKAWAQAIGFVGIPGAIALFVVYIGATEIPKITRQQELHSVKLEQSLARGAYLIELTTTILRTTQRACSNAAKDEPARQKCFDK